MSGVVSSGDSGLLGVALIAGFYEIPVEAETLRQAIGAGNNTLDETDILKAADVAGLTAASRKVPLKHLAKATPPGLALLRDGRFVVLARCENGAVLLQDAVAGQASQMTLDAFDVLYAGRLIEFRRKEAGAAAIPFSLSWFFGVAGKYRRLFGEVLAASFILQLFGLVSPLMFQVVIDKVLVHRGLTTLDVVIIGLLAVTLFEALLTGLRTYLLSHTTNRMDVEFGARLFRQLMALPMSYFESRRIGESVARLRELETVRNFLTGSTLTFTIDAGFTVVFLAVMYHFSPVLTAIVLATIPVYLIISFVVTPLLKRRLDDKAGQASETQAFMVELLGGIETLKAMAIEPRIQRRFEDHLAQSTTASFRAGQVSAIGAQLIAVVGKLTTVALLWLGALLVMKGDLSVGQLVAFNMLSGRVAAPILRLAQLWQDFQQVRVSIQRLADIMNSPSETRIDNPSHLPALRGRIDFEQVSFRYRADGPEVLSEVSFSILPGQVVGIVGTSGSGKSTLAKLIQRLHVPERGRVLIDGIDMARTDTAWLRRQIGVVLQDNVLFNMSVRENIALADPLLPVDKVIAAAELAGAHDFILSLPQGYDTMVGERGMTLSGGQRQRIAIARALATDPRILIFDEATSALDTEAERAIQANMRQICAGRTVILIAHRLSTLHGCDHILTLENGRLIESGDHGHLLAQNGRYAQLYQLQTGTAPAAAAAAGVSNAAE
ncbi:type I secretion system permease/ATPase [Ferrovibrio sp.]|uniref:type I secretion system permease/ATPase n=1 Tax=Ferrovibrio sp. TaxID=1917215 RepID=UPI003511D238